MLTKTRIACCGDSITFGLAATGTDKSYPSVLQTLLGDKYDVRNYGKSGATVIDDYEVVPDRYSPYVKAAEYEAALNFNPNTVVLMLGMNDGNPTHHFNSENGGKISDGYLRLYKRTLEGMLQSFKALPTRPKLYLAQITAMKRVVCESFSEKYVNDFTDNLKKLRKLQTELAADNRIVLIDTLSEMQAEEYYADGCHLTDDGYARLAEIICKALRA